MYRERDIYIYRFVSGTSSGISMPNVAFLASQSHKCDICRCWRPRAPARSNIDAKPGPKKHRHAHSGNSIFETPCFHSFLQYIRDSSTVQSMSRENKHVTRLICRCPTSIPCCSPFQHLWIHQPLKHRSRPHLIGRAPGSNRGYNQQKISKIKPLIMSLELPTGI